MKRSIFVLSILALLIPTLSTAGMGGGKLLKVGAQAPDFEFIDIEAKKGTLQTFAPEEPMLLVFLQTACRSCQREMAFLKEMNEGGTGIDVLAIFVDMRERDFGAYVSEHGLPFRFIWDGEYKIADQFGVSFTPSSFLLDGDRTVAKVYRGWSRAGKALPEDIKALKAAGN